MVGIFLKIRHIAGALTQCYSYLIGKYFKIKVRSLVNISKLG